MSCSFPSRTLTVVVVVVMMVVVVVVVVFAGVTLGVAVVVVVVFAEDTLGDAVVTSAAARSALAWAEPAATAAMVFAFAAAVAFARASASRASIFSVAASADPLKLDRPCFETCDALRRPSVATLCAADMAALASTADTSRWVTYPRYSMEPFVALAASASAARVALLAFSSCSRSSVTSPASYVSASKNVRRSAGFPAAQRPPKGGHRLARTLDPCVLSATSHSPKST